MDFPFDKPSQEGVSLSGKEAIRDEVLADKELRKRIVKEEALLWVKKIDSFIAKHPPIHIEIHNAKDYKEVMYDVLDSPFDNYSFYHTIYYNKTLQEIYTMKQAEYIVADDEDPLPIAQMIYPAKIPTKDYFPFADYDYGTVITFPLPEGKDGSITIDDFYWWYCIIWLDPQRLYVSIGYYDYYFKQVGKDLHFIKLVDVSTV